MVRELIALSFLAVAVLAACAGVADLDVKYKDVAAADAGGSSSGMADVDAAMRPFVTPRPDAGEIVDPSTLGQVSAACPCDTSQGLACCAAASGSTCMTDQSACDAQNGAFLRCSGPDLENSFCCLHRHGASLETALAAECQPGASIVCTRDNECPSGKCTLGSCPGGVTIGTCDGTPVCP